ncbi:MarR family transcriptional regulator [Ktedonosporobacter rubrisoli]|uniref:MarR family transcriptional regulator n=1 Tax=Ktedonosporobacter rubrisoli TaxID=2509675 RepID=A0A4P6JLJ4_KTERU|nr:MarR family transcriptional regulator [Ktedonosporobacter rubrisoli]QBD75943.1 MarR family transcriptional regulator [Ktedonosporobacter rubrisoli]
MSSGSQDKNAKVLEELMRELRQSISLSSSLLRAATTRTGMAVTDIQVLDLLELMGPLTAGQLAELTGLTTGAITRILVRLEKVGLLRRERDKIDGRKIIVRLAAGKDDEQQVRSILPSVGKIWGEAASRYNEEQIAFLLEFLQHSNRQARQELLFLQQEAPAEEEGNFSAPLEEQVRGRLAVSAGNYRLSLRADTLLERLYQARFEGPLPRVSTKDGAVIMRYPRNLLRLGEKQGIAEIALSAAIPWRIALQDGTGEISAHLRELDLAKLEVMGGYSLLHLELGTPSGVVPIFLGASISRVEVQRPAGVAVRIHITGWVSELVFDGQRWSGSGPDARLQSPGFDPSAPCYAIEVTGYAEKITIFSR